MRVTIMTPTYNRVHLLPRLYDSLCAQSYKDFEWLVVDDGSTDGTEELIARYLAEGRIDILYILKPNGGKHTAVNRGVKEAKGELLFIADSDDWLPPTAIADVVEVFAGIKDDDTFAGVCGLDQYADGSIVGTGLPLPTIDSTSQEIYEKWGVHGDLKEVFRTEVLRQYPFPEIPGEKFCPETLLWSRICLKYRLRYFNKAIYSVEYQPDGLSNSLVAARMKSPIATMMTYSEWFEQANSFKTKLRLAINYWRFALCAKNRKEVPIAGWGKLLLPVGAIFHLRDKKTLR